MTTFSEWSPPVSLSQIEELERSVNLHFPDSYKEHMLKFNGGKCSPNVYPFIQDGEYNGSNLSFFFAIDNTPFGLESHIIDYKIDEKRLPNHILPIGVDDGGNLICISCEGQDRGAIYFWDHENEVDYTTSDDSDYSNLYLIAPNFQEFLDILIDLDTFTQLQEKNSQT